MAQRALNFCRRYHVRIKSYAIKHTAISISLECNYHPFGQEPDVTQQVSDGMAVTDGTGVLRDIAAGPGPRRHLFALGFAGWAGGQLEAEMTEDSWVLVPADPALLFDHDVAGKWRRALDRQGIDL